MFPGRIALGWPAPQHHMRRSPDPDLPGVRSFRIAHGQRGAPERSTRSRHRVENATRRTLEGQSCALYAIAVIELDTRSASQRQTVLEHFSIGTK